MQTVEGSLTERGTLIIVLVMISAVLGVLLQFPELLAYSLILLFVTISAMVGALCNLQKLKLRVENPMCTDAGKKCTLSLLLDNSRKVFDAYDLNLQIFLPHGSVATAHMRRAKAGEVHATKAVTIIPQRASVIEVEYTISSGFPFGLVHREIKGSILLQPSMVVYPRRIIPRELWMTGKESSVLPDGVGVAANESGDMRGVRPWRAGDPAKLIHWKASARSIVRGHGLRVKELEPPSIHADHCHVVFHSHGKGVLREDRFERAISFLTGTLHHLYSLGVHVSLHTDFFGWHTRMIRNRKELINVVASLSSVRRADSTEVHELSAVFQEFKSDAWVIVVSDLESDSWIDVIDWKGALCVIDIRQIRFESRNLKSAKEALSA